MVILTIQMYPSLTGGFEPAMEAAAGFSWPSDPSAADFSGAGGGATGYGSSAALGTGDWAASGQTDFISEPHANSRRWCFDDDRGGGPHAVL